MKKNALFLFFFIASFSCGAQTNTAGSADNILDSFFHIYEKNGLDTSLDTLFSYGDVAVRKALPYIKDTLAGTIKVAGKKYCGAEIIIKKNVTPSYCYYSYLVKYPANPIRYNFIFYKPEDKWILVDFSFNSNIASEAVEFGKLENLIFKPN